MTQEIVPMQSVDIDPQETSEWLEALSSVVEMDGKDRAEYLLKKLIHQFGGTLSGGVSTPYLNTIPRHEQPDYPGDLALEQKAENWIRWNAALMVAHANKIDGSLGGHISTYASSCSLYEIGFNHFFKAGHDGDMIYYQGHAVPGIYARSFILGELELGMIENFRQQVDGKGVGSYPHPFLQPTYWQFPTVSMGLGPITSIYQARFLKYMHHRGFKDTAQQKVWAFCGDGEMDEPESLGAITRAGREKLDNLIFVINCNLQRLDGLVNGNGKIIQELESTFLGAGWKVIKVIWGAAWEKLIEKDTSGLLLKRMTEACDGDYQSYQSRGGAYMRTHFFGKYPELLSLVADLSDDELHALPRGGHEHEKIYAAYKMATDHVGSPVVILTKTIKGFGLGAAGESKNIAHNVKKLKSDELRYYRDRLGLGDQIADEDVEHYQLRMIDADLPEVKYLHERRAALGGQMPKRAPWTGSLQIPSYQDFAKRLLEGTTEGREMSTTTAYVQILTALTKDPAIGKHIVPITPDESRTFGMEGLFRQLGIYNPAGQHYEPEDRSQVMWYKEATDGQILQEGINEVGSMGSWIAVGTSYANLGIPMIPMYIFYSMFGFQRTMDLCWLAGDARVRGFLLGATAGRTTLNGEGLQHEDGHSHLMANLVPSCIAYDPTYAYELAVIIESGLKRMYANNEDVYFYITMMNENYAHPAMPTQNVAQIEEGILKGLYPLKAVGASSSSHGHVQLLGAGAILREVEAAAELLLQDFGISSDVWSMTSPTELYRNGIEVERHNRLHGLLGPAAKKTYLGECLEKTKGPIIASTDYVRLHAGQLQPFMPRRFIALGADGYGRSDSREKLRSFFEVDRYHVVIAALNALVEEGVLKESLLMEAIKKYHINPNASFPMHA
jgi:pyruvate dehydrogenase E1 component